MPPIDHTCDGADKQRCGCRKRKPSRIRRDNLRRAYGITPEEYDELRRRQGYRCAICRRHEDELPAAPGGRPRKDGSPAAPAAKLVVDHCHRGGGNRGLLCQPCNHGLGNFADDPGRLLRAVEYLRR